MSAQLVLEIGPACKFGCPGVVVGNSITGNGHVCKRHNVKEWGEQLSRNRDPYYRGLGATLLDDFRSTQAAPVSAPPTPTREGTVRSDVA